MATRFKREKLVPIISSGVNPISPSNSSQIEAIVQKDYTIRIGEFISRGWQLFKQNIAGFIGYTLPRIWCKNKHISALGGVVLLFSWPKTK